MNGAGTGTCGCFGDQAKPGINYIKSALAASHHLNINKYVL
jgi:hypothetical protein